MTSWIVLSSRSNQVNLRRRLLFGFHPHLRHVSWRAFHRRKWLKEKFKHKREFLFWRNNGLLLPTEYSNDAVAYYPKNKGSPKPESYWPPASPPPALLTPPSSYDYWASQKFEFEEHGVAWMLSLQRIYDSGKPGSKECLRLMSFWDSEEIWAGILDSQKSDKKEQWSYGDLRNQPRRNKSHRQ